MIQFSPGQQQQPPVFGFFDEMGSQVHPVTKYCLSALGGVGGLFYGVTHHVFIAVPVIGGFVLGLLAIPLLLLLGKGVLGLLIVAAVAVAAFYLFKLSLTVPSAPLPAAAPSHHARPPHGDDPVSTAFAAAFQSTLQQQEANQ